MQQTTTNARISEGLMQVAAWYRGRKTTSGRQTTTSGLTETANTAVLTRRSTNQKPLDDRQVLPVICDIEYSLPVEPEVAFPSPPDVP